MKVVFEDPDFSLADMLNPRKLSDTERELQAFIDCARARQRRVLMLVMPDMSRILSMPPPSTYVKYSSRQTAAVMDWQYWRAKPKLHRELTWSQYKAPEDP